MHRPTRSTLSPILRSSRTCLINTLLVFVPLLLFFSGFELFLRVRPTEEPVEILVRGTAIRDIGMHTYANAQVRERTPLGKMLDYRTNSDGFRDREYRVEKPFQTFRILGTGDSFTYGMHVSAEDRYLDRLEKRLNERADGERRYEVINIAECGIGQWQMLQGMKEIGMKYHPDLVLLGVYVGNDFSDNMNVVEGKDIEAEEDEVRLDLPFEDFLKEKSRVVRFGAELWARFAYSVGLKKFGKLKLFARDYPEEMLEAFRLTEGLLVEIKEFLNASNTDLCLVLIPMQFQVNFYVDANHKKRYVRDLIDIDKPQSTLRDMLTRDSICHVDLLNRLRQERESRGKELYFPPPDIHWNSLGHAIAAEEVYEFLKTNRILPE